MKFFMNPYLACMALKVIITGSTGMVGEGVMQECIESDAVQSVLLLNRRESGHLHRKISEIVHKDFYDINSLRERLSGYDACFFCLGVSSIGMKEDDYRKVTYDLTLHIARTLLEMNPQIVFTYVSGLGTDSSEKGRLMWARVKGKTENDLLGLPFKGAYMFRPAFLQPTRGLKNTLGFYKYVSWMYPFTRKLFPAWLCTLEELGKAMINVTLRLPATKVLEVKDIVQLAK